MSFPPIPPALDTIEAAGETRILGHVPPVRPRMFAGVSAIRTIPESEWQEFDLRDDPAYRVAVPILDQNGKGACNGHAAASSLHCARYLAGQTPVKLSPWFVYSILCGGRDVGSNIGDALDLLSTKGTCRFESVPYATINPRVLTQSNYAEAARFKIEIGWKATTFAELMTLAQLRIPFNYSIRVGNSFNNLDSEGCPPVSPGPGNHAVFGGIAAKRMKNGKWKIGWDNSWKTMWGIDGSAWFREEHITYQSYFEAYGVVAPYDDPSDTTNPPMAV